MSQEQEEIKIAVTDSVKPAIDEAVKPAVKEAVVSEVLPSIQKILEAVTVITDASMNPDLNTPSKPWFLSKSVIGGIVAGAAGITGLYGMDLDQAELEGILVGVGGIVGSILAIYGRVTAKTTLTK